jgi:hypothetical protein
VVFLISGNNIYTATYSPRAPGTYLLNVLWSGRQVRGCPLKVVAEPGGTNNKVSKNPDRSKHFLIHFNMFFFVSFELDERNSESNDLAHLAYLTFSNGE